MNEPNKEVNIKIKQIVEEAKLACEAVFVLEKAKSSVGAILGSDEKQEAKQTKHRIHYIQRIILLGVLANTYNQLKEIEKEVKS